MKLSEIFNDDIKFINEDNNYLYLKEYKLMQTSGDIVDTVLYSAPSYYDIIQLINKFSDLRGMYSNINGKEQLVVWDAYEANHSDIRDELIDEWSRTSSIIWLFFTNNPDNSDWKDFIKINDNYYFGFAGNTSAVDLQSLPPLVKRCLPKNIEIQEANLFENNNILYHGTLESKMPSIQKHGLDPKRSNSSLEAVFLTDDLYSAKNYTLMHQQNNEKVIILEIDTSMLNENLFGPDNYELPEILDEMDADELEDMGYYEGVDWSEISWQDSLQLCNQVAYYGVIPPEAIRSIVQEANFRKSKQNIKNNGKVKIHNIATKKSKKNVANRNLSETIIF